MVRERKISLEGIKSPPFFNLILTRMHNTLRKWFNGGGFRKANQALQANIESGNLLPPNMPDSAHHELTGMGRVGHGEIGGKNSKFLRQ